MKKRVVSRVRDAYQLEEEAGRAIFNCAYQLVVVNRNLNPPNDDKNGFELFAKGQIK